MKSWFNKEIQQQRNLRGTVGRLILKVRETDYRTKIFGSADSGRTFVLKDGGSLE